MYARYTHDRLHTLLKIAIEKNTESENYRSALTGARRLDYYCTSRLTLRGGIYQVSSLHPLGASGTEFFQLLCVFALSHYVEKGCPGRAESAVEAPPTHIGESVFPISATQSCSQSVIDLFIFLERENIRKEIVIK